MPQVLKPHVRERILGAASAAFFEQGYDEASMAGIARAAEVSAANIYRYFPDKAALFDAVLPDALIAEHDRLLDERVGALVEPVGSSAAADDLLAFWSAHRLAVATLLDHEGATTRRWYGPAFVDRLVDHVVAALPAPPSSAERELLVVVFDNTRRAIAHLLRSTEDPDELRSLIAGFWSYQLPGLDGLVAWLSDRVDG